MRKMAKLTQGVQSIQMTSAFRGYNHNDIIADGELYDMQNLSGDRYPLLSLRKKRGISSYDVAGQPSVPLTGIHGRDSLRSIGGMIVFGEGATAEATATAGGAEDVETEATTVKAGVNLRAETDKGSELVAKVAKKGTAVTILAEAYDDDGVLWYFVRTADGEEGYVRGDMVKK